LGLSRFAQCSEGEKDRLNIAAMLGRNGVLIDEFTSNLDRSTARRVAEGLRNYVRRHRNRNVVLLSCHCDFVDALEPMLSWTFYVEYKKVVHYRAAASSTSNSSFSWDISSDIPSVPCEAPSMFLHSERMWLRPKIRLFLKPAHYKDFEARFAKYHYMAEHISVSASCFTVWAQFGYHDDDEEKKANAKKAIEMECVGFTSILHYPNGEQMKDAALRFQKRDHRTVVLPPYQGMGFGSRICDAMALYCARAPNGTPWRMQSKTAHPRYGRYRDASPLWMPIPSVNHTKAKRSAWNSSNEENFAKKKEQCALEKKKMFYSHVFKLREQRSETDQFYLDGRVIDRLRF